MQDNIWYKVIVLIVLLISIVLRVQFSELSNEYIKYVWPMQIVVLAVFGVMIFGITRDQTQFKQAAIDKLGYKTFQQKVKVQAFVTLVMTVYLILTLLPLPASFSVFDSTNQDQSVTAKDISVFTKGWLTLSTVVFLNVFFTAKIVKLLAQRWLTNW